MNRDGGSRCCERFGVQTAGGRRLRVELRDVPECREHGRPARGSDTRTVFAALISTHVGHAGPEHYSAKLSNPTVILPLVAQAHAASV